MSTCGLARRLCSAKTFSEGLDGLPCRCLLRLLLRWPLAGSKSTVLHRDHCGELPVVVRTLAGDLIQGPLAGLGEYLLQPGLVIPDPGAFGTLGYLLAEKCLHYPKGHLEPAVEEEGTDHR